MVSFSLGKMLQTRLVKICLPNGKNGGLGGVLSRKEGSPFLGQLTLVRVNSCGWKHWLQVDHILL